MRWFLPRSSALLLVAALGAPSVHAQLPEGTTREEMWPAPTGADWAKPCLITWQRTFEDAVAVSEETQKPILICVNMDGEIASEHYAGIRYRSPEIAKLYEPYVCVIASVYRHTPRDYDEQGRRIPCPRFGIVTCGEHIAIEPGLYEKYFEGQRIAPRHIAIELDRSEVYDVFYAWDTQSVFDRIRTTIEERTVEVREIARGDRPLDERVSSRHVVDRVAVETAYRDGDTARRRALLEAALEAGDALPLDLLRMAIFGFDQELSGLARQALAQAKTEGAIDLINEALRVPMDGAEREALIAALERLGEFWPRAGTLAVVHRGLAGASDSLDVQTWSRELDDADRVAARERGEWSELEARLVYSTSRAKSAPEDPDAKLAEAEAFLAVAVEPETGAVLAKDRRTASKYARLMLEDAWRAAQRAEELGASGWRLDATLALAAYYTERKDEAYARAQRAVAGLPPGDESWTSMAALGLFAEARKQAILDALRAEEEWPGPWLADVHAAYSVIASHPLGTDSHVVAHYDFLRRLGAEGRAAEVLERGLGAFPSSWLLHDRLRGRALAERGIAGLEAVYEEMLARLDAPEDLGWFAGYASLVAAEFQRRAGKPEAAVVAYERAIARYERYVEENPENRASADHYVAVAHGALGRLAYERGDWTAALERLLASFERKEDAAASLDGLGISAVGTAKMLLAKAQELEATEIAARVQAALDALDPQLLELPEFERGGPPPPRRAARPGRGRGR